MQAEGYPTASWIMHNLSTPYPQDVTLVEEFLEGRHDYPQEALLLGESSEELANMADFLQFFLKSLGRKTRIAYGSLTHGNLYYHNRDIIHLETPNILIGLHEVGHSLYGESEFEACRYSTSLLLRVKQYRNRIPVFEEHKLLI